MSDKGDVSKTTPKDPEIRFRVSKKVWEYLEWLSRNSVLGDGPSDVAEQVLLRRLSEMRQEEYRPPDKL